MKMEAVWLQHPTDVRRVPVPQEDLALLRSQPAAGAAPGTAGLPATRVEAMEARFRDVGDAIPLPPHWGGFRLAPAVFEFWQGRESRLHDRIRYRRHPDDPEAWTIDRLAP